MLDRHFTQLFFIALFTTPALAQSQNDTIIVSADRIKSSLETSPSDIKVFEEKEIQKSGSIVDLLNKQSDLKVVQSGPYGSNTSLFLRGTDSSHTLVVIDGIVMNDPSNPNRQFDLGRLSLNNIERIEILKGSQGLLYGSNAIGGVVVITTKMAKDKLGVSAQADYGSFQTMNAALSAQKKWDKTELSVGIDHFKTKGFSAANVPGGDDDGEKRTTVSANLKQYLTDADELSFNSRFVDDNVELDKGGGIGNDDPDDSQQSKQRFLKGAYTHTWSNAITEVFYAQTNHKRTLNIPETKHEKTEGTLDTVGINHTQFTNDFLTQNLNIDFTHEEDLQKHYNENLSAFLYNRFAYGPAVATGGLRLDSNKYFGKHVTYKIAVAHFFSRFNLKLSYSTGFRAPSLNQLFDPAYGNKNLSPEESQTADMSFEVPIAEKHKYIGTLFYTELKNRLSYDPVTFVNQNRGRARIIGVENNFEAQIMTDFKANLGVTWMSAQDMSARKKLARRPNLSSKLVLDYTHGSHEGTLESNFTGKRDDVDNQGNAVKMPSYLTFNASYAYHLNEHFQTYAKVQNILDKEYEEAYGYGTGGRAASLGLKYDY